MVEKVNKEIEQSHTCWEGKRFNFNVTEKPIIVGIVNCTPDSYYDGNKYNELAEAVIKIKNDLRDGADIIEIGGKSTRPGHPFVSTAEEWRRISPVLKYLKTHLPEVIVAVDTDSAEVMEQVLATGVVDIINDVAGFETPEKLSILAKYQPSVVVMQSSRRSQPVDGATLQSYFSDKIKRLEACGLAKQQIVIDPGVGYSKDRDPHEDMQRIKSVQRLRTFGLPVMCAISRKGFLKKLFHLPIEERPMGTLLFSSLMIQAGARVLRVHDVAETRKMIEMLSYYQQFK